MSKEIDYSKARVRFYDEMEVEYVRQDFDIPKRNEADYKAGYHAGILKAYSVFAKFFVFEGEK